MCFYLTIATHLILPFGATKTNIFLPLKKLAKSKQRLCPPPQSLLKII